MKRLLLLAGFTLHVSIGGLCFAPVAAMAQSPVGSPVDIVAMTPKEGVVCVSVQLMSFANQDSSMQGGCADGHCLKMRTPEPLVTASPVPVAHQPAILPVPAVEYPETLENCDVIVTPNESPPIPPGVDTVVLRE